MNVPICKFYYYNKWVVIFLGQSASSTLNNTRKAMLGVGEYRAKVLIHSHAWAITYPAWKWTVRPALRKLGWDFEEDSVVLKFSEGVELPDYPSSYAYGSEQDLKHRRCDLHPDMPEKKKKQVGFQEGLVSELSHLEPFVGKKVRATPCYGFATKAKVNYGFRYQAEGILQEMIYVTNRVNPDAVIKMPDGELLGIYSRVELVEEPLNDFKKVLASESSSPKSVSEKEPFYKRFRRAMNILFNREK